jgi:hypothetical protein
LCLSPFCSWGLAPLVPERSGRDASGRQGGSERTDGWDATAAGSLSDWRDWLAAAALRSASTPALRSAILPSSVQLAPRGFRRKRDTTISSARKRGCAAPAAPQSPNAHTEGLADREQVLSDDNELAGRPRCPLALRLRISEDPCIAYTLSFMKATCSQHMRFPNIASQLHVAVNTSS